ncbi:MAG TPA: ABC transporter permease [Candidatus Obscuribacterales bacterium]
MSTSTPTPPSTLQTSRPPSKPPRRWLRWIQPTLLLGPAGLWLVVLLVLPTLLILDVSFLPGLRPGAAPPAYGLGNYIQLLNQTYREVIERSLGFALVTTAACLILGFPVSYWIALKSPKRWRVLLLIAFVLPLWTSSLLRAYAWVSILRPTGVLNSFLSLLQLPTQNWLYTEVAVGIGLSYSFLPYMVLILYASLEKLDLRLLEASADLGATPLQTFWKVTIPQTLPGIAAGSLLVFITSLGDFVVPELLGGASSSTMSRLIYNQFLRVRNWGLGSALSMLLIVAVSVAIALLMKYGDRNATKA